MTNTSLGLSDADGGAAKRIAPHRGRGIEAPAGPQLDDLRLAQVFKCFEEGQFPEDLTIKEYVYAAAHYELDRMFADQDTDTSWTENLDLIHFTRRVQFHPSLIGLSWQEAEAAIPWESTPYGDEAQLHIVGLWGEMRSSPWRNPVKLAVDLADKFPITPPRCLGGRHAKYRRTASTHAWLQVLQGEEPYWLTDDDAAKWLGISKKTANMHRKFLEREGFVKKVKEAIPNRRAARLRFLVEKFPDLGDRGEI